MARAFRDALRHIDQRVQIPRFLPEHLRLLHLAVIALQDRHAANGIGKLERRRVHLAAIEIERLAVTGFSQLGIPGIVIQVAEVTNGVRLSERIGVEAAQIHSFFVVRARGNVLMKLAFQFAQQAERFGQFRSGRVLAQQAGGDRSITSGVSEAAFALRLGGASQKILGCHSVEKLSKDGDLFQRQFG